MKSIKCPKCNCPMKLLDMLYSNSPIERYICPKCGYVEERREKNEIK